jgi:hypothetical protein
MTEPTLAVFTDRVAEVVTELNGLSVSVVNEEITAADFDEALTELLTKMTEVEAAVSRLANLFWSR